MKMYRFLLFAALFLLASCGSPDDSDVDWCYTFDFQASQNGFSIPSGEWKAGQGLFTDITGLLQFSYGHDRFVEPKYVIVTVARPIGIGVDIPATVAGEAFGIGGTFSAALPIGQSSATLTLPSPGVGVAGNAINVTVDSTSQILVRSIEIRGDGANPFPNNECYQGPGAPTQPLDPTLIPPTLVPSATNTSAATPVETDTPTVTVTASITPTITATDNCAGNVNFDMSTTTVGIATLQPWYNTIAGDLGQGGPSSISGSIGNPSPGINGYTHNTGNTGGRATALITFSTPVTITSVTSDHYGNRGGLATWAYYDSAETFLDENSQSLATAVWQTKADNNTIANVTYLLVRTLTGFNNSPYVTYLDNISIDYNSCISTPTVTQTPNDATQTAAATLTPPVQTPSPGPGYTCVYSFALNGGGGFQSVEGSYSNGVGWLGAELGGTNKLEIERSISSTTVDFVKLFWLVEIASASLTITEPYGSVSTINVTGGSRNQIMSGRKTNVTLLTFLGTGSAIPGKRLILVGAEVHGQGERPEGAVCGSPTETPFLTRTPLATGTARPITRTPISLSTLNVTPTYITATPGGPSLTPGGPTLPPQGTATGIANGAVGDAGQGINNTWSIGSGLGNLVTDWTGQVNGLLTGVFGDFNNAPPSPIPGLPLCLSNPTAHDWCAIIYIIEFTILADGTPGQLIVPILQIFVYIYLLIYFVRGVLWLARRGESFTNVS